jgi:hypothetical protein
MTNDDSSAAPHGAVFLNPVLNPFRMNKSGQNEQNEQMNNKEKTLQSL